MSGSRTRAFAVGFRFGAGNMKEGPEELELPAGGRLGLGDREHASQSPEARASQDMHEDGLGLVVSGMSYGNAGRVLSWTTRERKS